MKVLKLLLSLTLFLGLVSCSSGDDDSNAPVKDVRIVGKWQIESYAIDGEYFGISDCEAQTTVEFFANGNVTTIEFFETLEEDECFSEVYTEKWEYRGNNVYRIMDGKEYVDVSITFSNYNNSFTISEEDDEGIYSVTYVRI